MTCIEIKEEGKELIFQFNKNCLFPKDAELNELITQVIQSLPKITGAGGLKRIRLLKLGGKKILSEINLLTVLNPLPKMLVYGESAHNSLYVYVPKFKGVIEIGNYAGVDMIVRWADPCEIPKKIYTEFPQEYEFREHIQKRLQGKSYTAIAHHEKKTLELEKLLMNR